jgi:SAM-dependent methyltransferase
MNHILAETDQNSVLLEVGCGAGNITRALADKRPDLTYQMLDIDPDMLQLAEENTAHVNHREVRLESLFAPSFNEKAIIHSHGVLEHFSDEEIRQAIELYKAFGPQIHYVPGAKYVTPSRGDERLLSPEEWMRICSPDEIISFNDGFDLILKFK